MTKLPLFKYTTCLVAGFILAKSTVWADSPVSESPVQSLEVLAEQVNQALVDHYTAIERFEDVAIETITPDNRLQLDRCDGDLQVKTPNHYSGGRVTTQVACEGDSNQWSLYVVNHVNLYAEVLVARTPVLRGQIISDNDLELVLEDVSMLNHGYLTAADDAVGMETKRSLNTGDQIRAQWLLAPRAVKRGEKVTLIAHSAQVAVETTATALSDGRMGEQIRVRNDRSDRVVRATVSGTREVSIAL